MRSITVHCFIDCTCLGCSFHFARPSASSTAPTTSNYAHVCMFTFVTQSYSTLNDPRDSNKGCVIVVHCLVSEVELNLIVHQHLDDPFGPLVIPIVVAKL